MTRPLVPAGARRSPPHFVVVVATHVLCFDPCSASLPAVAGCDGSGTVIAVGEGVTEFKAGDEVWGFHNLGLPGCVPVQSLLLSGVVCGCLCCAVPMCLQVRVAWNSGFHS